MISFFKFVLLESLIMNHLVKCPYHLIWILSGTAQQKPKYQRSLMDCIEINFLYSVIHACCHCYWYFVWGMHCPIQSLIDLLLVLAISMNISTMICGIESHFPSSIILLISVDFLAVVIIFWPKVYILHYLLTVFFYQDSFLVLATVYSTTFLRIKELYIF